MPTKKKKTLQRENVFQNGPYLQAAFICEKILNEKDNVKTAVRMVDRLTVMVSGPGVPEQMPTYENELQLFLKLKPGNKSGRHRIALRLIDPNGKARNTLEQSVTLDPSPNQGIEYSINLKLKLDSEGVYWFELYFDDFLWTKVPLELIYIIQRQGSTLETEHPIQ